MNNNHNKEEKDEITKDEKPAVKEKPSDEAKETEDKKLNGEKAVDEKDAIDGENEEVEAVNRSDAVCCIILLSPVPDDFTHQRTNAATQKLLFLFRKMKRRRMMMRVMRKMTMMKMMNEHNGMKEMRWEYQHAIHLF